MLNIDIKGWEDQESSNTHNILHIHEAPSILDTLTVHKAYKLLKIYEVVAQLHISDIDPEPMCPVPINANKIHSCSSGN